MYEGVPFNFENIFIIPNMIYPGQNTENKYVYQLIYNYFAKIKKWFK